MFLMDFFFGDIAPPGNSRGCGGSRWKLTKTKSPGPPKRTKLSTNEETNFSGWEPIKKQHMGWGQHGLGKCVVGMNLLCLCLFFSIFFGMIFFFQFLFWLVLFCFVCLFVWLVCLINLFDWFVCWFCFALWCRFWFCFFALLCLLPKNTQAMTLWRGGEGDSKKHLKKTVGTVTWHDNCRWEKKPRIGFLWSAQYGYFNTPKFNSSPLKNAGDRKLLPYWDLDPFQGATG